MHERRKRRDTAVARDAVQLGCVGDVAGERGETARLCATWDRGDPPDFFLLDPDVVFESDFLPDHAGETYRGREGVMRSTRTWLEPFERFTIELEQIVGSGDRLVSIHRFRFRARYIRTFREPKEALEADGRAARAWRGMPSLAQLARSGTVHVPRHPPPQFSRV